MRRLILVVLATSLPVSSALGQRNLKDIPDPDPTLQQSQFEVADGFEICLFAADPQLAKPIQMNFDSQGRLWVASSEVYPQIEPGQIANDKVLVLDDTDGDGKADSTTVFADGLLIPTGVLPGDGGCYVANSTELLHFTDTDGDGQADKERVVLSGFGTEDTHHILHTLRWGPGCSMYMNQSIYIHSHIETPYGVRRMNGGGTWWFRPDIMRLETYTLGCCNPWGHAWNRYGVSFGTDGAYGEGINYYFPGFVGPTSPGAARVINGLNSNKPKLCSVEYIDGTHLPEEWRGNLIANDFRAHRVCRYVIEPEGSAFSSREGDELVKTRHVAFRPIDVKMGPDGAIYIADWYNPIIQHGEVDFRDWRRDHQHGRIWRITATGRPLVPRVNMDELSTSELCEMLASPEPWRYQHAKQVLKERGLHETTAPLNEWLWKQDPNAPDYYQHMLQVFWAFEAQDYIRSDLLDLLLRCRDDEARASATRALYNWHDRIRNADEWIELLVVDPSARVRLEAVRAASKMRYADACQIALRALDLPVDRFLDFCLWTTARDLKSLWLPALEAGEIDFDGNIQHLVFALRAVETPDVASKLLVLASNRSLDEAARRNILDTVARTSTDAGELRRVLDVCLAENTDDATRRGLLDVLLASTEKHKLVPAGDLGGLQTLLGNSGSLNAAVLRAAGLWKIESLRTDVLDAIAQSNSNDEVIAAMDALVFFRGEDAAQVLRDVASDHPSEPIRIAAAARLMLLNPDQASSVVAGVLSKLSSDADPAEIIRTTLTSTNGPGALSSALAAVNISADVARAALNEVGSSGLSLPDLVTALRKSGKLANANGWQFTAEQRITLLAEIASTGDAWKGEQVYRRTQMACQKCHAIGGAGGHVGPDLASIGASAQPDYILESILEPGKKIKENYHSLIIVTDEGKVVTGIKLRETEEDLLLRNSEDKEFSVPLNSIDERSDGGSLMPAGLVDTLTRTELVNLIRYLSELGKIGDYALPREQFVRNWEQFLGTSEDLIFEARLPRALAGGSQSWVQSFSTIDGSLPIADLPTFKMDGLEVSAVRFSVARTNPLQQIRVTPSDGIRVWVNGLETDSPSAELQLPKQNNEFVLLIDRSANIDRVSVQIIEAAGK